MRLISQASAVIISIVMIMMAVFTGIPNAVQAQPTTLESEDVQYELPFPGMLPDNPLYFLKDWRDQVQLWFASEGVDTTGQYLDLSDKQIAMAYPLLQKGKVSMAIETGTRSNELFQQAIEEYQTIEGEAEGKPELLERMRNANVRHRQEIENLMKEAPQDQIAELEELHNQTTELEARLQEL